MSNVSTNRREECVRRNIPVPGRRAELPVALAADRGDERFSFLWAFRDFWLWVRKRLSEKDDLRVAPVVLSVDLRISENREAHHTLDYEGHGLILRRGQSFEVTVEFDRNVDLNENKVNLEIHFGDNPCVTKDTLIRVPFNGEDGKWEVRILKQDGGTVSLVVTSPANAIVGKCALQITANTRRDDPTLGELITLWKETPVYFLFNAWCEDDGVYLKSDHLLEEYVLNDTGFIYVGSHKNPSARPWNFGQFEYGILDAAVCLLEAALGVQGRSNPVKVVRRISALVNSLDDDGVLCGNWSGDYIGGVRPAEWVGSVAILKAYMGSKQPVRFGQCWVFSGVTTTVLRCLGIPTRSVTNFSSAHDKDCSMTIDTYWDQNMDPISDWNSDSVWNFHVWNECWMTRPDLPVGHGGWQLVDGTPQETSDGVYQTGPASLTAIKTGLVYYNYDTEFAFAEVNADKVHWQAEVVNDQVISKRRVYVECHRIGKMILTKAVGEDKYENITDLYKFPEGSTEERLAVQLACSHGSKPETYIADKADYAIKCEVVVKDGVKIGDNFDVTVRLTNEGADTCIVSHLYVSCHACHYTGIIIRRCQKDRFDNVVIEPDATTERSLHISYLDYADLLPEHATMKIYLIGQIEKTKEVFAEQDDFSLTPPTLEINVKGATKPRVGQQFSVSIEFTNPLDKPLTNVRYTLEGPGIQKTKTISHGNIQPKKTARVVVALTPTRSGKRKLVVVLHCKELIGVTGFAVMDTVTS